jgi:hypothetical protein
MNRKHFMLEVTLQSPLIIGIMAFVVRYRSGLSITTKSLSSVAVTHVLCFNVGAKGTRVSVIVHEGLRTVGGGEDVGRRR